MCLAATIYFVYHFLSFFPAYCCCVGERWPKLVSDFAITDLALYPFPFAFRYRGSDGWTLLLRLKSISHWLSHVEWHVWYAIKKLGSSWRLVGKGSRGSAQLERTSVFQDLH